MTRVPPRFARIVSRRLSAWLVILAALAASGALITLSPEGRTTDDPTAGLPDSAQSMKVAELQRQLPSGQLNPAVVVYSRPGDRLSEADLAAVPISTPRSTVPTSGSYSPPPRWSPSCCSSPTAVRFSGSCR